MVTRLRQQLSNAHVEEQRAKRKEQRLFRDSKTLERNDLRARLKLKQCKAKFNMGEETIKHLSGLLKGDDEILETMGKKELQSYSGNSFFNEC